MWWRVGVVVGYIYDWVVVFVVVGKEKETREERERERERGLLYFILLSSLYYFIELYVKIKTEI